jgi:hypothetical protein
MNIAVLIGISDYKTAPPLPACAKDVADMNRLLTATNKYDDVLCISANTHAAPLKDALRSFFAKHQASKPIQEALVHFSGHGVYHNDVLLCCSDFDPNRPASTAVSNEELDDLLRSVNPDVAVKILDACQSGSPYIKDTTPAFEKALGRSRLKSFICMASSKTDQSSFATADCSFFTNRFIEASLSRTDGTVLYRDIQAALADSFAATPEQTPFFVTQGTGLEVFAAVTPDMRALKAARQAGQISAQPEDTLAAAIGAQVQKLDALYVSAERASQAVEQARNNLDKATLSVPLVAQFYEKSVSFEGTLSTLPAAAELAKFADEQGWAKSYFLDVAYESVKVRVPKNVMASLSRLLRSEEASDVEYVTKTIQKPVRLVATEMLPLHVAQIRFEPKGHPSLKSYMLYLGLAHSLADVLVLSAVIRLIEKGWTGRALDLSSLEWQYRSFRWKDVTDRPDMIWEDALARAQATIQSYLEGLVPKKDERPVEATDTKQGTAA